MRVTIGEVATFPDPQADKAQVMKVLEECAEVFSAWEDWQSLDMFDDSVFSRALEQRIIDECADLIQATCNLLAGLGVEDMSRAMEACRKRNEERGRLCKSPS